jgi:hypothetical protein
MVSQPALKRTARHAYDDLKLMAERTSGGPFPGFFSATLGRAVFLNHRDVGDGDELEPSAALVPHEGLLVLGDEAVFRPPKADNAAIVQAQCVGLKRPAVVKVSLVMQAVCSRLQISSIIWPGQKASYRRIGFFADGLTSYAASLHAPSPRP